MEKLGSSVATDGGATTVQKRGESSCSSTRRLPIASGRSGSASGASALHVSGIRLPVALAVGLWRDEIVESDDRRLARRIPDRGSPRPRQHRGLDRGGGEVAGLDHVVEQPPRAVQRALPEDRVADEPVPARGGEQ